jgi:hypothetical protein
MKPDKNIYVDAIAKLINLTQNKKIKWSASDTSYLLDKYPSYIFENVFIAKYKEKYFRIFKSYQKAHSMADSLLSGFSLSGSSSTSKMRTITQVVLEIIDEKGKSIWEFPNLNIIEELLSCVIFQASGVNDLLNDLINE